MTVCAARSPWRAGRGPTRSRSGPPWQRCGFDASGGGIRRTREGGHLGSAATSSGFTVMGRRKGGPDVGPTRWGLPFQNAAGSGARLTGPARARRRLPPAAARQCIELAPTETSGNSSASDPATTAGPCRAGHSTGSFAGLGRPVTKIGGCRPRRGLCLSRVTPSGPRNRHGTSTVDLAQAGHPRRGCRCPVNFEHLVPGLAPNPSGSPTFGGRDAVLRGRLVGRCLAASRLCLFNALFGLRPATVQLLRAQLCYLPSQSKHDYGNPTLSITFRVT